MDRPERKVLWLPAAEIRPNPMQPGGPLRRRGPGVGGIHPPPRYPPAPDGAADRGGLGAGGGERRPRATVLAGLETVPCLEAEVDGRASALLALVENLQRKDLHYLEEAEAIAAFLHQTGMTQEAVAAQLGMSPSALANKPRLLRLSPACRAPLVEHGLTERHACRLLRLEDEGERLTALRQAAAKHWNVAQTEQYVERRLATLRPRRPQDGGRTSSRTCDCF